MSFFQKIQKSIYSPDFYRELASVPFSHSLKYFLTLNLLLTFIGTIIFSVRLLPDITMFAREIGPAIVATYPTTLELTMKKGVLSTNENKPSFIKIPREFPFQNEWHTLDNKTYENLLVIDTATPPSIERLREYKTLALATREVLMYETGDGIEFQAYEKIPDTTITKPVIESWVAELNRFLPFVSPITVALFFIGLFAIMNGNLLYLLVGALFIWAIAHFKHLGGGYGKSYQIGLHANTSSILVWALFMVSGGGVPYVFTAVFVISVFMNMSVFSRQPKKMPSETEVIEQP